MKANQQQIEIFNLGSFLTYCYLLFNPLICELQTVNPVSQIGTNHLKMAKATTAAQPANEIEIFENEILEIVQISESEAIQTKIDDLIFAMAQTDKKSSEYAEFRKLLPKLLNDQTAAITNEAKAAAAAAANEKLAEIRNELQTMVNLQISENGSELATESFNAILNKLIGSRPKSAATVSEIGRKAASTENDKIAVEMWAAGQTGKQICEHLESIGVPKSTAWHAMNRNKPA